MSRSIAVLLVALAAASAASAQALRVLEIVERSVELALRDVTLPAAGRFGMTRIREATSRETPILVVPTCTMQGSPALQRRRSPLESSPRARSRPTEWSSSRASWRRATLPAGRVLKAMGRESGVFMDRSGAAGMKQPAEGSYHQNEIVLI